MEGRRILLAVTGSIAAYKIPILVRLFVKAKSEVKILITESASHFVSPSVLATLSKNDVFSDFFEGDTWNNHVELGLWAEVMLIAPASANTIAKMAAGLCDNMVLATYLSAKCPVFFAPAMDRDMWKHPATQRNVQMLQSYGNTIIPVQYGELASGLIGEGRMAEPEEIFSVIEKFFSLA
ncbi:MAG: flavoprotein [Chitinophagales bacterium]|nr:flavoprotein [Chitinophagales bacterium]